MSPREEIQNEIRDTLFCLELNEVYGIIESKQNDQKGKSYRALTFCRAGSVDGEVRVYSPRFIMIKYQTTIRRLPHKSQEVFRDVSAAKRYLQECFA
jgi:hypothetical protein